MAAPNFAQGWKGTVSINGNLFNTLQYTFSETADLEDITYTVAGGATYAVLLPGYRKASGTLTFVYDTANQPTISPFDMRAGTLMTLILYPEGTKPFSGSAYSSEFSFASGPQAGVSVKCTCNYQTTGTFTEPTS